MFASRQMFHWFAAAREIRAQGQALKAQAEAADRAQPRPRPETEPENKKGGS
ncbi:hypothetical protein [Minwuia thermotolerans]|uniref:hypothetical protein n=1 Tax=Minwuia thermotolerans TaxID=2056226 RepID=UPI0013DE3ECF|nr:hypothetical protein [Minwuia thermotolerans]